MVDSDDDLAKILQTATEKPANSYGGQGTPACLKVIEIMGIERLVSGEFVSWMSSASTCALNVCFLELSSYVTLFDLLAPLPELNTFEECW